MAGALEGAPMRHRCSRHDRPSYQQGRYHSLTQRLQGTSKNYLGFGILRRPTSCIHAVVGFGILRRPTSCVHAVVGFGFLRRPTSCAHAFVRCHRGVKNRLERQSEPGAPIKMLIYRL